MEKYKGKIIPTVWSYVEDRTIYTDEDKDTLQRYIQPPSSEDIKNLFFHHDCNAWGLRCDTEFMLGVGESSRNCTECLFSFKDLIIEWAIDNGYITKEKALEYTLLGINNKETIT